MAGPGLLPVDHKGTQRTYKKTAPEHLRRGGLDEMPGGDLLSRGETPNYHRRWTFSLPSSEWNRVGPVRYCHQAKKVARPVDSGRAKGLFHAMLIRGGRDALFPMGMLRCDAV